MKMMRKDEPCLENFSKLSVFIQYLGVQFKLIIVKKVLSILILSLTVLFVYAQEPYSYHYSEFHDRDYVIEISHNKKQVYTLHIEVESLDDKAYFAGIKVSQRAMTRFIQDLITAKEWYTELKRSSQRGELNVTKQRLDFNTKVLGGYFKKGTGMYTDHSIKPVYTFEIIRKQGRTWYLMRMSTGRMISPIFEHIQCTGAEIAFSSEKEIDEFIERIQTSQF